MIKTKQLNNGLSAVAKDNGNAFTFANRTQAERKLSEVLATGLPARIWNRGPVFYVIVDLD